MEPSFTVFTGVLNSVMSLLLGFGSVNSVVLEPVVNLVISVLARLSVSNQIYDFVSKINYVISSVSGKQSCIRTCVCMTSI